MAILNKSKVKGNSNNTTQIETQNIYYQSPMVKNEEYIPDEKAIKLLKEAIEDERNNYILFLTTFSGKTIQCGYGRFSVNSEDVGAKEMAYWEDSFRNLINNNFLIAVGTKGEVFNISKKGYDFYDKYILKDKEKNDKDKKDVLTLNKKHIDILKMLRENNYSIWESQLIRLFKADIDNEIAFNELMEYGYIEDGIVVSSEDGSNYLLNPSKKKEVLLILKENN